MKAQAVGLARVSTTGQAEDGCSLALQEEKIRAYASLNDLALISIVVEAGVSGRAKKREGLDSIVAMVRSRQIQHLIVYKLDRMSRSLRQAIEVVEILRDHDCQLHSITEKIDTSTSTGRFFFHVIGAIASWEAETIAERTKSALQGKKERGEVYTHVAYGFSLSDDGKHLVVNPAEQKVISRIRRYHKEGVSLNEIAGRLNSSGYTTKWGRTWSHKQVARILQS